MIQRKLDYFLLVSVRIYFNLAQNIFICSGSKENIQYISIISTNPLIIIVLIKAQSIDNVYNYEIILRRKVLLPINCAIAQIFRSIINCPQGLFNALVTVLLTRR